MGKKINTTNTTKTNNTVLETLDTVQLDTIVQPTVEPTVEPLFTKFTVLGLQGTLISSTPVTVLQFSTQLGGVPVQGVPSGTKNKIPQNLQLHKSTVQNPVKYFFSTIDQVVQSGINTRSGIIQWFVNKGVSYYTVRTQYQIWYKLNKGTVTQG